MKEYIITEEQVHEVFSWLDYYDAPEFSREIRGDILNRQLSEHDAEIRRQERERVLDAYCEWDDCHWTKHRIAEYKLRFMGGEP